MKGMIAHLFSIVSIFPFVSFILCYTVLHKIKDNKKFALDISIYISVILLLFVIGQMNFVIFDSYLMVWGIILFALILYGSLHYLQLKSKRKVNHVKTIKASTRMVFIILNILYIILFIGGIVKYI